MDEEMNSIQSCLQLHNDYFKTRTDLIPARYYFEQETPQTMANSKFFHNSKGKTQIQLKDKLIKRKKKKASNKRERLDPTHHQSVTDIQHEMDQGQLSARVGGTPGSQMWREKAEEDSECEVTAAGLDDFSDEGSDKALTASPKPRIKPVSVESITSNATIDELKEKVRQKIEQLRTKRKATAPLLDAVPKKVAKKNAENERKKKKMEALKAIKASKAQQEAVENAQKEKMANGMDSGSDDERKTEGTVRTPKKGKKSVQGGESGAGAGSVSFSQFDFAESEREAKPKKKRKKQTEPRSNKDYGRLLKKAELKQQKMVAMKEKDPDRAEEEEMADKWKAVMDRAQGLKVKDDVDLLKKSLKRKEKRKKQSTKQWAARRAKVEEKMKERSAKRRKNIKAKTDARKAKKVKRLQRKGKLLLQD